MSLKPTLKHGRGFLMLWGMYVFIIAIPSGDTKWMTGKSFIFHIMHVIGTSKIENGTEGSQDP